MNNKTEGGMMAKYTKITVFGSQVRVAVKPDETVQSVLYRAQMRYLRRYFGKGVTGWMNTIESRDGQMMQITCSVLGRNTVAGTPIIGDFQWVREYGYGTDVANSKAITIASLGL
jgi:hypothetical protein